MTTAEKKQIQNLINEKIEVFGSLNSYAKKVMISSAQLSNLKNNKWELISAEMWRKLADLCGLKQKGWVMADTSLKNTLFRLLEDSKEHSNVYAITAPAGSGKTYTSKLYSDATANVFYVACAEYWNKKGFLIELVQAMGKNPDSYTTHGLMAFITRELMKMDAPLIILDEADKLKDEALYFFITLYNHLEDRCGIVMLSTDHFQKRIKKGLTLNRKGYQEIYSRMSRKFVELPSVGAKDILRVCQANGIEDNSDIDSIINTSENDLRRVKKLIHAKKIKKNHE